MTTASQLEIVSRRMARQRGCGRLTGYGLGVLVAGIGIVVFGNTAVVSRGGAIAGSVVAGLGLLAAIVGLLGYFIVGLGVRSAVSKLDGEDALEQPITPGERFGGMRALEAGPGRLHLSLGVSPVMAGLGRALVCVLLLAACGGLVYAGVKTGSFRAYSIAGLCLFGAAMLASLPFAMQWIVGELPAGGLGIEIERVRWFFRRDLLTAPAGEIEGVFLSDAFLTLKLKGGRRVALVRTSGSNLLDRWNKQRLIAAMSAVLERPLSVEEG